MFFNQGIKANEPNTGVPQSAPKTALAAPAAPEIQSSSLPKTVPTCNICCRYCDDMVQCLRCKGWQHDAMCANCTEERAQIFFGGIAFLNISRFLESFSIVLMIISLVYLLFHLLVNNRKSVKERLGYKMNQNSFNANGVLKRWRQSCPNNEENQRKKAKRSERFANHL